MSPGAGAGNSQTFSAMMNAVQQLNPALQATAQVMEQVGKHLQTLSQLLTQVAGGTVKLSDTTKQSTTAFQKMQGAIGAMADAVRGMAAVFTAAGAVSTAAILGMVSVANPGVFYQWRQVMTDLSGVLGTMFAPIVNAVVPIIRSFVNWLWNLPPAAKSVMAAIGVASAVVVAGLGAVAAAIAVVNVAMVAFNTVTGGVLLVVGLVVVAIAALGVGVGVAAASMGKLGDVAKFVQDAMAGAWRLIGDVLNVAWTSIISPVLNAVAGAMAEMGSVSDAVWGPMRDAVASVIAALQVLGPEFGIIAASMKDVLVNAAETVLVAIKKVAEGIAYIIDAAMKAIITAQVVVKHGLRGLTVGWEEMQKELAKKLGEFEAKKIKAKLELDRPADKAGPAAPNFGQTMSMSSIEGAKELFWKAAMEASSGGSPEVKAIGEVEKKIDEGNKILKQMQEAFGVGPPRPVVGGAGGG